MRVFYDNHITVSVPALPEDEVADKLCDLIDKNDQIQGALSIIGRELGIIFEAIPGAIVKIDE